MCPLAKYCEKILLYNAPFRGVFFIFQETERYILMRQILKNLRFSPKKFDLKMHMGKPEN